MAEGYDAIDALNPPGIVPRPGLTGLGGVILDAVR